MRAGHNIKICKSGRNSVGMVETHLLLPLLGSDFRSKIGEEFGETRDGDVTVTV